MVDITTAESDLAAQVDATLGEITTLEAQVKQLQDAVAAGTPDPQVQAAADAIEAQVQRLKGSMPTVTPPASTTPADTSGPATTDPSAPASDAAAPPTP